MTRVRLPSSALLELIEMMSFFYVKIVVLQGFRCTKRDVFKHCLDNTTCSICFIQSLLQSFRRDELDEELNDELKKSAALL